MNDSLILEAGEESYHYNPLIVEDLPIDMDWDTWGRDAICFALEGPNFLKIYALNPHDGYCYHLTDFYLGDRMIKFIKFSCTMKGSRLYLLARTSENFESSMDLWIWDISHAQKEKLRERNYQWKLGPPLNSAKEDTIAFFLGSNLYALNITTLEWQQKNHVLYQFECLQTNSSSSSSRWRWVPRRPPPCLLRRGGQRLELKGYGCIGDSRFLLHMTGEIFHHYFFCYDAITNRWTHHRHSGPLTDDVIDRSLYFAHAQELGLIIHPASRKFQVFDFSSVFKFAMLKNSDVAYDYPSFEVNVNQTNSLKDLNDYVLGPENAPGDLVMWQTFHLGGEKFCCLAFFHTNICERRNLHLWICTFDLKKMKLEVRSAAHNAKTSKRYRRLKTQFCAQNDVSHIYTFNNTDFDLRCPSYQGKGKLIFSNNDEWFMH